MATLTYATDIAPHLERGLHFRRLRMQRLQVLHRQHEFYDEDEYDPYSWAKTNRTFKLFFGVIVLLCYAGGCETIAWLKDGRSAKR